MTASKVVITVHYPCLSFQLLSASLSPPPTPFWFSSGPSWALETAHRGSRSVFLYKLQTSDLLIYRPKSWSRQKPSCRFLPSCLVCPVLIQEGDKRQLRETSVHPASSERYVHSFRDLSNFSGTINVTYRYLAGTPLNRKSEFIFCWKKNFTVNVFMSSAHMRSKPKFSGLGGKNTSGSVEIYTTFPTGINIMSLNL